MPTRLKCWQRVSGSFVYNLLTVPYSTSWSERQGWFVNYMICQATGCSDFYIDAFTDYCTNCPKPFAKTLLLRRITRKKNISLKLLKTCLACVDLHVAKDGWHEMCGGMIGRWNSQNSGVMVSPLAGDCDSLLHSSSCYHSNDLKGMGFQPKALKCQTGI